MERRQARSFAVALLTAFLFLLPEPVAAADQDPEGPDSFVKRAAFAERRLWLLTDSGSLSSIAEGGRERRSEALVDPVLDLCADGALLRLLTGPRRDARRWKVTRRDGGRWIKEATVDAAGERLLAMNCDAGRITLLTDSRLIQLSAGTQRSVALVGEMPGLMVVASSLGTERELFLGINAGEWGGGLHRIDRTTGQVTPLERNISGHGCGGPLNTRCDPVNGLATHPSKPNCLVAAIGLVHFFPRGRLVEVCRERIERIYFKGYDVGLENDEPDSDGEPGSTVAFYGLARTGGALWAVGIDGLYRLSGSGEPDFRNLPRFQSIGGIHVSFAMPDMVLVLTEISRRASVSGAAPMIVPR